MTLCRRGGLRFARVDPPDPALSLRYRDQRIMCTASACLPRAPPSGREQDGFVVTEAGFGADIGMEKFFNIKARTLEGGSEPECSAPARRKGARLSPFPFFFLPVVPVLLLRLGRAGTCGVASGSRGRERPV